MLQNGFMLQIENMASRCDAWNSLSFEVKVFRKFLVKEGKVECGLIGHEGFSSFFLREVFRGI